MADSAADTGFELSVQQELLWSREPEEPTSRSQLLADLPAGTAEAELRPALDTVVRRHEILRTVFRRPAGLRLPLQVVLDQARAVAWTAVDLSDRPNDLAGLAADEAAAAMDHAAGPLLRAALLRLPMGSAAVLLTASGAVADAESLTEVASGLRHLLASQALGEEPVQYADYAAWQREQVAAALHPSFEQLVGGLPFAGRPRPRGWYARAAVDGRLDPAAIPAGATTADGWLAAWLLLLGRLTGERDVPVGLLDSGRTSPELAGAVGPYARVLAVRADVDPDSPFACLVEAVRDAGNAAAAGAGIAPPTVPEAAFGFAATAAGVLAGHPQPFQLRLTVAGERATVESDPEAVGTQEGRAVATRLSTLLANLRADPARPVGRLDVVPAEERRRLLEDLNRTQAPLPPLTGVHELVAQQAARTADRPAVAAADRTLTYAELDRAANRLAHLLLARGVTPGTPVGLCLERTSNLVVAVLGVLKAGGAYLPLNPDHPKARLALQLADSGASVVVTSGALSSALPETGPEVVCVDAEATSLDQQPSTPPAVEVQPADPAYVIYTSGSTGRPKGVAVSHRNLGNYVTAVTSRFRWDAEPLRFALVTTVSTDLGNTCLFPSLVSGGILDLVPVDVAMEGSAYARYCAERSIDVLKITPTHLGALLAAGGAGVLPHNRLVLGGEALPWTLADQVTELGDCAVTNHYGPTETTVGSVVHDVGRPGLGPRTSRTVPIGRPLANTRVYLLDEHRAPVPTGAPGELYVGGAGVANGYWRAPERTAEAFLPDPFSGSPGDRMYRTGDLARWLPDGDLEFLGRIDDQVKIRGFRVEPGEVEHALVGHPRVAQVAVLALPDAAGDPRLVAYVVAAGARIEGSDIESLRGWLADRLPEYMIPSAWVPVGTLPLLPNGKLARDQLPAPESAALSTDAVPPRTETEHQVAAIWSRVLGLESVGVTDDFFSLGGHSLLATQVIARIRSGLGVQLPLPSLFLAPTVAGLAAMVDERRPAADGDDELARMLAEIEDLSEEEAERLLRHGSEPSE